MKKWVHATNDIDAGRIKIDFYNFDVTEDIQGSSGNKKRLFNNYKQVVKDVTDYISQKGFRILSVSQSSNRDSDSTYIDVDIKLMVENNGVEFLYLRISDHPESDYNKISRINYHANKTRTYKGLPDNENVDSLYSYKSIEVSGKAYNNYDKAMNRVKQEIDDALTNIQMKGRLHD